jgi:hypothetical protein
MPDAETVLYRRSTGEYLEGPDPAVLLAEMRRIGGDWRVEASEGQRLSQEDRVELEREATEQLFDLLREPDHAWPGWRRTADNGLTLDQDQGVAVVVVVHVYQR